jgi:hypothetical protein
MERKLVLVGSSGAGQAGAVYSHRSKLGANLEKPANFSYLTKRVFVGRQFSGKNPDSGNGASACV